MHCEHLELQRNPATAFAAGFHQLALLFRSTKNNKIDKQMNTQKLQINSGSAAVFQPRLHELVKFIEKNESTIMCNEWCVIHECTHT